MQMDFGKYRGVKLQAVPTEYLEWCLDECAYLKNGARKAIQEELAEREETEKPVDRFMEERRC